MNRLSRLPGAAGRAVVRGLDLIAAFVIPAGIYTAILAVQGIYPFGRLLGRGPGGSTVLTSDLNNQYAQFYAYLDQVLTGHGSLLFTWRADLGMNFWPIVSYYLTSPFGLITLMASDQRLPIMIAVMMVLKLGTAGFCMALLLRRFRGDGSKAVAVLLSSGYALMAWALVYAFNIMWLDALFLLPLVLLGIEALLARGRVAPLAAALGATFVVNFYTGAMIAIFAVLYGVARYFGVREAFNRSDFLRTGARFAAAGAIGALISAVFLLPTYVGGISQRSQLSVTSSVRVPVNPLSILVRFFGGTVDNGATTPDVAAGTLLLLLVPLFFTVKGIRRAERIAFGTVLVFLLLAMEVPPLYLLMHGGDMPNAFPYRFAFLITALMAVLAFRAWVGVDSLRQVKTLVLLGVFWFAVLFLGRQLFPRILTGPVTRFNAMILFVGTAALAFALWIRVRDKERGEDLGKDAALPSRLSFLPGWLFAPRTGAAMAVVVLGADVAGSALLVGQKKVGVKGAATTFTSWYRSPSTDYSTALSSLQPNHDDFFRAEGYDRTLRSYNDSLRFGNLAQTHFSSLASGRLHAALSNLGFAHHEADVWASHTGSTLLTDALLAYRYLVTTTSKADGTANLDRAGVKLVETYGAPAATWNAADVWGSGDPAVYDPAKTKTYDATKVWQIEDTLPVGFRLDASGLSAMTRALPVGDPFAAQEQVFQMPGAFASMCSGTPTVTGSGMGVRQVGDQVRVTAAMMAKSATLTWDCESPGRREVYMYAPDAIPGQDTYVRINGFGAPAAKTGHPLNPDGTVSKAAWPQNLDRGNKSYPYAWSNGLQDFGTVPAGPFSVTLTAPEVEAGRTYKISSDPIRGLDPATAFATLAQLRTGGVTDEQWNDTGLSATTTGADAATVFFSVAAIPGWNVTVDGRATKTTELLGAFVGVPVDAGTHRISFSFTPPGLYAGAAGSFVGLLSLGGVWWFQRRRPDVGVAAASTADLSESIPEEARA